jgi:DNA end-binding protein Ku
MRSIWSGTISFGLVNIPVKLVSAVQEENIDFDMLSKDDLAPIRYARIDTKTGEEVPYKDIVKGYQYAKGKYVVVDEKDFEKASPEKTHSIDIAQFVKAEQIDSIYYEKPYYIIPGKGAAKSYKLLLKALEETASVGIAEFMLRNRVHVCAIKPHENVLLLNQMRYEESIKEVPDVELGSEKISAKEVGLAVKLIEQLSEEFNPAAFKDTYIQELTKVIKAKAAGKQIRVVTEPKKSTATVKDLMSVLKESLNAHSKKRA